METIELKNKYASRLGKQYRTVDIETKDIIGSNNSRRISGYAAIFNNVDKAKDVLIKGCFSKSIQERGPLSSANDKILLLWMHKMDEPIGKIVRLEEDDKGLYFEADIDEVDLGDRAIKQLMSGTLNQFSIGYSYVWDKMEYDQEKDAFICKELDLFELSPVSIGCNGETEFLGMKSVEDCQSKYEQIIEEKERALSGLPLTKRSEIEGIISSVFAIASFKTPGHIKEEMRCQAKSSQNDGNSQETSDMKINLFKCLKPKKNG